MSEDSLKQVQAAIAAKRTSLTPEEAKELAVRAFKFKKERGRLPSTLDGCLGKADGGRRYGSNQAATPCNLSQWKPQGVCPATDRKSGPV
jgi:hypothetical protein